MTGFTVNAGFVLDKHFFFSKILSSKKTGALPTSPSSRSLDKSEYDANVTITPFLLQNRICLEAEFITMFNSLKRDNQDQFWLYCYYCACQLEQFYKAYGQKDKEHHYSQLKQQLVMFYQSGKKTAQAEKQFINSLYDNFLSSIKSLVALPQHLAQIRDNAAFINICRIYWAFTRLTLTQGLRVANDLSLLEKLDKILGTHTNAEQIISVFEAPLGAINYLSVGFFLGRFIVEAGLLLKHTFFPSELEQRASTSPLERFKYEFYKRHCNFVNDLVWGTVNFLTNLNHLSGIPGPVAGYLTAGFLGFDVGMALYKCYLAKQDYLEKKTQFTQELAAWLDPAASPLSNENRLLHIDMLQRQLTELEISWRTKQAAFYFNAAAATLLMSGFTASLLLCSPVLITGAYFICTVAMAMYLSANSFAQFKEKGLYLEQRQLTGANNVIALREYEQARNEFIVTMIKNSVVPLVLIGTFAICWPAALVLTAMYLGFEGMQAYNKHTHEAEIKRLGELDVLTEVVGDKAVLQFEC